MLDIQRMNKRITIKQYRDVVDEELEQAKQELVPVCTVWAGVVPTSGKEFYEAYKISNKQTYKIYTRYLPGITTDMVIEFKGKIFEIVSVINYRENNELLRFVCIENVGEIYE
ncbi:putative head-tail adaptor [Lachnospiraceae bacterium KM106-2]|nr:putative head-tail adaptor [Lachnospiraceae bacterium KM106-2]